jgi:cobalt-zinc-cadmium efflux system outer membrane protein
MTALFFAMEGMNPIQARAEGTNTVSLTEVRLSDAKRIAFEKNWDLLAARANVDIASAQKLVASEFPNPTVSLSTSKINTDGQPAHTALGNSLIHRNYDTVAAFNQLIEIGGKRSARKASAHAAYQTAAARFADQRRQLDLAVTGAYVGVLLAEEQGQVLRASASSLRKEASIAEARLKAGDISLADRDQISIAADRLELDAQKAESDARTARIQLETLLGITNPTGEVRLADSLAKLATETPPTISTAPNSMLAIQRPDVVAAETDVERAKADLKLQKAMRIPDPTLLAEYERNPEQQPNTVGFGFSFPIPLWNLNKGNIAAAKATVTEAEVRAKQARAAAAAEIAMTHKDLETSQERRRRFEQDIEPRSAAIVKTVRFAYEKGGASLIDLLTAERNDNEVRVARANATADYLNAEAAYLAAINFGEVFKAPAKR